MKLLIITQKVDNNDGVLGFFHDWIAEFAKHCEQVTVICLFEGVYELPGNVKVLSLGKERNNFLRRGGSIFSAAADQFLLRLRYIFKFYRLILGERKNYDAVFVHMNPEYVVLGGIFWKIMGKKIGLWYAHGSVNVLLRIAERIVDYIFSASSESFRIKSAKKNILGHGIDVRKFNQTLAGNKNVFIIVSVGRISPVKKYEVILEAAKILVASKAFDFEVRIIGGAIDEKGRKYLEYLEKIVLDSGLEKVVEFVGEVANKDLHEYLHGDVFVHTSQTGSLDKAMLEAMAAGLVVISSNDAAGAVLKDENLLFDGSGAQLAEKIARIHGLTIEQRMSVAEKLKKEVAENHNLGRLIKNILRKYER